MDDTTSFRRLFSPETLASDKVSVGIFVRTAPTSAQSWPAVPSRWDDISAGQTFGEAAPAGLPGKTALTAAEAPFQALLPWIVRRWKAWDSCGSL